MKNLLMLSILFLPGVLSAQVHLGLSVGAENLQYTNASPKEGVYLIQGTNHLLSGIDVDWLVRYDLGIQTGIRYGGSSMKFNSDQTMQFMNTIDVPSGIDAIYRTRFLELPLGIHYYFGDERLRIFVGLTGTAQHQTFSELEIRAIHLERTDFKSKVYLSDQTERVLNFFGGFEAGTSYQNDFCRVKLTLSLMQSLNPMLTEPNLGIYGTSRSIRSTVSYAIRL